MAALLFVLLLLAVCLRVSLWHVESGDERVYFAPWREVFTTRGAFHGLGLDFADYTPPYLYLLSLSSLVPLDDLHAVKVLALLLDSGLVVAVHVLARAAGFGPVRGVVAAAVVAFLPTVVFNGAAWGQVDASYTALLVLALAAVLRSRSWWAMALFGLALAVKLQAVFLAPLFLILVLLRVFPVRAVLAAPVAYLAAFLPAIVAGRPLSVIYSVYVGQTKPSDPMTLNAPNLYQLLPDVPDVLSTPAILVTAAVVVALVIGAVSRPWAPREADVLRLALLFALVCPYLLPHMHERYFFVADVLAVLYALVEPNRWLVPLAVVTCSFLSYLPFLLTARPVVPLWVLSLVVGAVLVRVLIDALDVLLTPAEATADA
jgi:Gpi18-like mannosyltransferase